MTLLTIPFQDLLAYLGKFIHWKCVHPIFLIISKEHTWETSRINDFTGAIIFISTPARDKAGGMKASSQQKKRSSGMWHNWKIYTVQGWFSELILNAEKSCVFLLVDLHSDFVYTYRCFIYRLLLHCYCEYYIYIMLELAQCILASATDILFVIEKEQSAFLNMQ